MKLLITLGLIINSMFLSCGAQKNLIHLLNSQKKKINYIGYVDSIGVFYSGQQNGGVAIDVIFDSVKYSGSDSGFVIQGQTIISRHDTRFRPIGVSNIRVFTAYIKKDSILHIEILTITNDSLNVPSRVDGFFKFMFKPQKEQKLFFAKSSGDGLIEFDLDKLVLMSNSEKHDLKYKNLRSHEF